MLTALKTATRKSPLALRQANFVRGRLLELYPGIDIALHKVQTQERPPSRQAARGQGASGGRPARVDRLGSFDIVIFISANAAERRLRLICERGDERTHGGLCTRTGLRAPDRGRGRERSRSDRCARDVAHWIESDRGPDDRIQGAA